MTDTWEQVEPHSTNCNLLEKALNKSVFIVISDGLIFSDLDVLICWFYCLHLEVFGGRGLQIVLEHDFLRDGIQPEKMYSYSSGKIIVGMREKKDGRPKEMIHRLTQDTETLCFNYAIATFFRATYF